MKKQLLFFAALFFIAGGLKAQVSYGVKAGLNFPKLNASAAGVSGSASTGSLTSFYVSGYVDAPIASNFSFQPGLSLQGKGGKLDYDAIELEDEVILNAGAAKANLMYVEIPLNFVYYVPAGDAGKVFVGAGPYAGFGVSTKTKFAGKSSSDSFKDAGLKAFDAGLNFLVGFKLNNGFLINGGYGLGLTDIDKNKDANMKNRVFSVGIGFQI